MTTPPAIDDGVFELPGPDAAWLWAHTCPEPRCRCRSAVVLATTDGRDALLKRGAALREVRSARLGYAEIACKVKNVEVFVIDIDTARVFSVLDGAPLDLAAQPVIRAVVDRIDGEILDGLGRLWYRGKGRSDPEVVAQRAPSIFVRGWRPGDRLGWNAVIGGVRKDLYPLGNRTFEGLETYSPVKRSEPHDVVVEFTVRIPRGGPSPGRVAVRGSGKAELVPARGDSDVLDRLWAAYRRRHPRYIDRFARRASIIQEVAARVEPMRPEHRRR